MKAYHKRGSKSINIEFGKKDMYKKADELRSLKMSSLWYELSKGAEKVLIKFMYKYTRAEKKEMREKDIEVPSLKVDAEFTPPTVKLPKDIRDFAAAKIEEFYDTNSMLINTDEPEEDIYDDEIINLAHDGDKYNAPPTNNLIGIEIVWIYPKKKK